MLQRINLALMIIVILVVGAVSLQVFTTQRYNTLVLQAITTELANMKTSTQPAAKMGHVIVEGDLKNPGRYAFSLDGSETRADLFRKIGVGREKFLYEGGNYTKISSILDSKDGSWILRDGEEFRILDSKPHVSDTRSFYSPFTGSSSIDSSAKKLPGKWQQIDEDGKVIEDGMKLNVSDPNDFMNLSRSTMCRTDDPLIMAAVRAWLGEKSDFVPARVILVFSSPNSGPTDRLEIGVEQDLDGRQTKEMGVEDGRWQIKKNDRLYLNLGAISPNPNEPLIFEKVK